MKELTIEEKAKRYDEVLKEVVVVHKDEDRHLKSTLERIFPELTESEDERIRKELLEHCKNQAKLYIQTENKCPQIQSWVAWLEKKGEKEDPQVYQTEDGEVITYSETDGYKVFEPKFHEGDWIVNNNNGCVCKVTKIRNDEYCL